MYKYQEPGFTGYKKKDVMGLPCTECAKKGITTPSVYSSTKLCYPCSSERSYKRRLKLGQVKQSLKPSHQQMDRRPRIKIVRGDIVMPFIRKGFFSRDVFGNECADRGYSRGCITVSRADRYCVWAKGVMLRRESFFFVKMGHSTKTHLGKPCRRCGKPSEYTHTSLCRPCQVIINRANIEKRNKLMGLAPPRIRPKGQANLKP